MDVRRPRAGPAPPGADAAAAEVELRRPAARGARPGPTACSTSRPGSGCCSTPSSRMAADLSLDGVLARIVEHRQPAGRRPVRRARRARHRAGAAAADLRPPRHGRRARSPRSATLPDRSRAARPDHRPARAAAAARHRRAPGVVRLPAAPPADELVPRRAGADPGPGLRQPLPDREGGRRRLHRAGRGDRGRARRRGRRRDRERPALRGGRAARALAGRDRRDHRGCWPARRREDALQAVADRAREVAGADVAWVVAGADADDLVLRVVSGADADSDADARRCRWSTRWPARWCAPARRRRSPTWPSDPRAVDPSPLPGWPALGPGDRGAAAARASGVEGVLALAWTPEHAERCPRGRPRAAGQLRRAGRAGPPGRPGPRGPAAARAVRGPRPDRPRPARPGHPAAVRGRAQPAGRAPARPTTRTLAARLERAVDDLDAHDQGHPAHDLRARRRSEHAADVQTEVTRIVDRAAATMKFRPIAALRGPGAHAGRSGASRPTCWRCSARRCPTPAGTPRRSRCRGAAWRPATTSSCAVADDGRGMPAGVRGERAGQHARAGRASTAGAARCAARPARAPR